MPEKRRIPAPQGLEKRGRKFWRDVVSGYALRPDELVLLEEACKTMDLIDKATTGMAGQPLTVKGSMGQEREHPLLSEARQQRGLLRQYLAQLKLPDEASGVDVNPHRAGGLSRWAQHHGRGA